MAWIPPSPVEEPPVRVAWKREEDMYLVVACCDTCDEEDVMPVEAAVFEATAEADAKQPVWLLRAWRFALRVARTDPCLHILQWLSREIGD